MASSRVANAACSGTGKSGPVPSSGTRTAPATAAAQATGMKLRGFHSNSSSSTASSAAASGVPNTAAIPPAAPATSNVFRSAGDRWNAWPNSEPNAPPVMMIGPSAPNGPPVPMEMAEDSGLSTATRADMRLCPMRIASSASGMPWPRIRSEPYRAMSPTMRPPTMGTNSAQTPRRLSAGETRRLSIAWYIEQVGEEPDESQQRQGDERADHSDQGGHARHEMAM